MASTLLDQSLQGTLTVNINAGGRNYKNVTFGALSSLCSDVILGQEFMKLHSEVNFKTGGIERPLNIPCCLAVAKVDPPQLFKFLNSNCRPIAAPSRRYNEEDTKFIEKEVKDLLSAGVIEEASTPWRAQVLVARDGRHKPRVVIDYSQTLNRYHCIPVTRKLTRIHQYLAIKSSKSLKNQIHHSHSQKYPQILNHR